MNFYTIAFGLFFLSLLLATTMAYIEEGNDIFTGSLEIRCDDEKPCTNPYYECQQNIFYKHEACAYVQDHCEGVNKQVCDKPTIPPKTTLTTDRSWWYENLLHIQIISAIILWINVFVYENWFKK